MTEAHRRDAIYGVRFQRNERFGRHKWRPYGCDPAKPMRRLNSYEYLNFDLDCQS